MSKKKNTKETITPKSQNRSGPSSSPRIARKYRNSSFPFQIRIRLRHRKVVPFLASSEEENPVEVMRSERSWPNPRPINVVLVEKRFQLTAMGAAETGGSSGSGYGTLFPTEKCWIFITTGREHLVLNRVCKFIVGEIVRFSLTLRMRRIVEI